MSNESLYDKTRTNAKDTITGIFFIGFITSILMIGTTTSIFWRHAYLVSSALIFFLFINADDLSFKIRFKGIIKENNINVVHISNKEERQAKTDLVLFLFLFLNLLLHLILTFVRFVAITISDRWEQQTDTSILTYTYFSVIGIILMIKLYFVVVEYFTKE